ncbi:MAG: Flp pilus assembly protein CpaB [Candidatus Methylacidiphilales bacterium]
MNKSFNFLVLAALVLGVVCVVLITKYVDARVKQARDSAPIRDVVPVDVLVAQNDITIGSKFNTFNTVTRTIPQEFLPASAVKSLADLEGKVALFTIPKDDMILTSKVGGVSDLPKASTIIEEGMRLVTIGVDDQTAAGYTIKNGDSVDLVGVFNITPDMLETEDPPIGNSLSVTFLQRVKVFDIIHGEDVTGGDDTERRKDDTGARRLARGTTVTFLVSPKEAEIILAANTSANNVYMILRRYDDQKLNDHPSQLHERIAKRLTGDLDQNVVVAPVVVPKETKRKTVF